MRATVAPLASTLPKEEYTSMGGSYINLGHFKNKANTVAVYKNDLLGHSQTTDVNFTSQGGLSTTKFGAGFQRRQVDSISNPIADKRQEHAVALAQRSEANSSLRSNFLKTVDSSVGYNFITGEQRIAGRDELSNSRKVRNNDGLGPEASKRGHMILKDTEGRFFAPQSSGVSHEYRQKVLVNEGLLAQRASSIIQVGKKDLTSCGIEDQFSKAEYMKTPMETKHGLHEMRQPGQYTPRKQRQNPSGNSQLVHDWTRGVDINCKAMRGGQD